MVEFVAKNVIIGLLVIVINSVPLTLKKYNLVPVTAAISLIIMLAANYIN